MQTGDLQVAESCLVQVAQALGHLPGHDPGNVLRKPAICKIETLVICLKNHPKSR